MKQIKIVDIAGYGLTNVWYVDKLNQMFPYLGETPDNYKVNYQGEMHLVFKDDADLIQNTPAQIEQPGGSTPKQYGIPENAKDLQDLIEYRNMNFAQGNIFKAIYRNGTCEHSDELREVRKIIWFAQREETRILKELNNVT